HEVVPGRPNVVAWLGDKDGGPSLLLEGHTDVVTEGDPREWTHPPFGAELVDGRIYGRGAADMKGGLAAAMIAAAAVRKSGATLHGRLVMGALVAEVPALEKRLRRLSEKSRYLEPPTVTPTIVQAPAEGIGQSNVIPSSARLTLDVRLGPGPDGDAVTREIDVACQRAMARCPGATIEWAPINGVRLATRVERSEPLVQ